MRDYLEPMLGTTGAMIAQFAITLVVLALIILVVFWLIRTFTGGGLGASAPRGRQPRLSILDALPVDQKRRLVLVRRDNVEHLILIGGPSDLVVEGSIHRPTAAQRRAEAAARSAGQQQRYASAPLAESGTLASAAIAQEAYAEDQVAPAPEAWRNEPPRQEPIRQDYERQEPVPAEPREEPRREEPRQEYREPREPRREVRQETRVEAVLTETVRDEPVDLALEPVAEPVVEAPEPQVEPAPPARALPSRPVRAATSFLGSIGRSRTVAEPAAEAPAEPRRPEPPARPLGRTTPLAPKAPEPPADEPAEIVRQAEPVRVEPLRAEPVRVEPVRAEPVRPQPRAPMPPAPPVAPPSLGDEPYGAPNSDPDAAPRFEPIFDIDPNDVRDPGRPVRPARESVLAAPSVAPQRPFDQEPASEAAFEPTVRAEPDDRAASVGDLEKEMARLLGEISGTRRT